MSLNRAKTTQRKTVFSGVGAQMFKPSSKAVQPPPAGISTLDLSKAVASLAVNDSEEKLTPPKAKMSTSASKTRPMAPLLTARKSGPSELDAIPDLDDFPPSAIKPEESKTMTPVGKSAVGKPAQTAKIGRSIFRDDSALPRQPKDETTRFRPSTAKF